MLYYKNGQNYRNIINRTGFLKFAAFDTCKSFGKSKQCDKLADVRRLTALSQIRTNSHCRIGLLLLVLAILCETLPKLRKSQGDRSIFWGGG